MFDRFRAAPPRNQLMLASAGVVAILIVLLIGWSQLRTTYRPLFTHLHSADAAAIVAELDRKKATYRLADDGTTVLVPSDRVDATRLDLMNGDLALKGTVGFELFNKSDMGLTDFAQRINYQRALQGELERTIMSLDGIDAARVHLSLGEDRIFRDDRVPPKASVTLRMRQGATLQSGAAAGIQRLVAAAVPQLDINAVVILDEMGQVISNDPTPSSPMPNVAGDERQAIDDYYAALIRQALQTDYAGRVAIAVDAAKMPPTGETARTGFWNPADRDFPLRVTLDPDPALDGNARQDIQGLAAGAVGFDSGRGDAINFGAVKPSVASPGAVLPPIVTASRRAVDRKRPDREDVSNAKTWWPLAAVLLIGVAGLAMLGLTARGRPRRLSSEDRERLAARLSLLLDQDGADHAYQR